MSAASNRNELWARVLLDEMARAGVRELVLAPGSRSTPLVLAAAADGRFRIRVQTDERSAGFLALGMGKATGFPAAVITTSGTAVANLLPAVVEAHQSETPLLVLTADRPPRLRGADANQTIEQSGIFGSYLRLFVELSPADLSEATLRHLRSVAARAVGVARGDPGGVVHLNLPFDTPLEPAPVAGDLPEELAEGRTPGSGGRPGGAPWTTHLPRHSAPAAEAVAVVADALAGAKRPLLVAGVLPRPWETGPVLRWAASGLGIPLLADALSGGRYPTELGGGDEESAVVVGGYDLLLRDPGVRESLRPDLILRFGAAPVSALLTDWLAGMDAPHILVDGGGRWKDHTGAATLFVPADPSGFLHALLSATSGAPRRDSFGAYEPGWVAGWRGINSAVEVAIAESLREPSPSSFFEGAIMSELALTIPSGELLFVSNSMPVRDLDTFVPSRENALLVLANRGASGIDGIVSTAAGATLATGKRVTAVVGDLALLHDANGLASLREPDANVVLIAVNNDGGGIFHFLPIRDHEPAFTPYFATPHGRDLRHLAELHGLAYRVVDLRGSGSGGEGDSDGRDRDPHGIEGGFAELRMTLKSAYQSTGSMVLEVLTDRVENRERRSRIVHEIAAVAANTIL